MTETNLKISSLQRLDPEGPPHYVGELSNGMNWSFRIDMGDVVFCIEKDEPRPAGAIGGVAGYSFIRRVPFGPDHLISDWTAQQLIARWIHDFERVPQISLNIVRLRPRSFLSLMSKYPRLWSHNYKELRKVFSPLQAAYITTRFSAIFVRSAWRRREQATH